MTNSHLVVDGSNIATEGRSTPSLAQLDQAVRSFRDDNPRVQVTVVVDATFLHRIARSERPAFEKAEANGEIVSPPAGAIGRGDAFLLRIAEKTGATVLSNDSFQEFHDEYPWLFDEGRLIGGKPVSGVGWIFTPRTPVRAPRSGRAPRSTGVDGAAKAPKRAPAKKPLSKPATRKAVVKKASVKASGRPRAKQAPKTTRATTATARAKAAGASAATEGDVSARSAARRRRRAGPPPGSVNQPLAFISFVADHRLGQTVKGEVDSFTSHGAFVKVGGARCYVPLSGLGDPPPRRAREVLSRGEERSFIVATLDPQRRAIELALPGSAEASELPARAGRAPRAASAKRAPARQPATRKAASDKSVAAKKKAAKRKSAKTTAKTTGEKGAAKAVRTLTPVAKKTAAAKVSSKKSSARAAPKKSAGTKKAGKRARRSAQ